MCFLNIKLKCIYITVCLCSAWEIKIFFWCNLDITLGPFVAQACHCRRDTCRVTVDATRVVCVCGFDFHLMKWYIKYFNFLGLVSKQNAALYSVTQWLRKSTGSTEQSVLILGFLYLPTLLHACSWKKNYDRSNLKFMHLWFFLLFCYK